MTSVYYLRHAESEMNLRAAELVGGRSNHVNLSPLGREQARLAGRWLLDRHVAPDAIIASPATRTLQTTLGAMEALGMPTGTSEAFAIDSRLQELSQGIMEGKLRHEVWTPEAVAKVREDPMNFAFEGGDSFTVLQKRMRESYFDIVKRYPEGTVLVVGHGLAIRALVGSFAGWDHAQIMAAPMPNCGLTLIEHEGASDTIAFSGRDIVCEQLALMGEKV